VKLLKARGAEIQLKIGAENATSSSNCSYCVGGVRRTKLHVLVALSKEALPACLHQKTTY